MAHARRVMPAAAPVATEPMRFAPDILRRLGEELIPSIDIGIVELVKNAYDADATECRIVLENVSMPGGTLRISDDGVGMDLDAIRDGWLVLGRSGKATRQRTALGRTPAGDKGLGRLAAMRLGELVELETRPAHRPGEAYRLSLDWSHYDAVKVVEDVPIEIHAGPTTDGQGTSLVVRRLLRALSKADIERLTRSLVLLNDPFDNKQGFRATLEGSGFDDLERRVKDAWFDAADYRLTASLDASGTARFEVRDAGGAARWQATREGYRAPPATFELWVYLLNRQRFNPSRGVSFDDVKRWLKVVGGVHVYHRGMRVAPYGEPGHDWLDMNLSRARSPEERPSTNTTVGRLIIEDEADLLRQKTDRSGFVEDDTFKELRRFAMDALDWMAQQRLKEREAIRVERRKQAPPTLQSKQAKVDAIIHALPAEQFPGVRAAVEELRAATELQIKALQDDMLLYRTLATVGVSTSVFAHETDKTVTNIGKNADRIEKRGRLALGVRFDEQFGSPLRLLQRNVQALGAWTALPLSLLERQKRQRGRVDVNAAIRALTDRLRVFLDEANIELELKLAEPGPAVFGTVANIDAVVTNLLVNAIKALQLPRELRDRRTIRVETEALSATGLLRVSDNGPGISGIALDDIWLPGETAFPEGTGLGLTIVRDVAEDMGGRATAQARGELGGATICVEFPRLHEGDE